MSMTAIRVVQEGGGEEEDEFFDSTEDPSLDFDSCPNSSSEGTFGDPASDNRLYQIWGKSPDCVRERRDKFMRRMGWDEIRSPNADLTVDCLSASDVDRITSEGGAVLRTSGLESGSSSISFEEKFDYRIKNLDDGRVFVADEFGEDGNLRSLREFGSDNMITIDEFERNSGTSVFVRQLMQREGSSRSSSNSANFQQLMQREGSSSSSSSNSEKSMGRRPMGWLRRLGAVACIVDNNNEEQINSIPYDSDQIKSSKIQRVRVRSYRKTSKEFSAVFMGQDIRAHDGSILTMKFSPDGQYLASGGEDGVVRVWSVMAGGQTDEGDLPEDDPSCIYFTVNHNSELAPLYAERDKKVRGRTSDSACVVVPPDAFRIHDKPLHEFCGHHGDVLDLSWSNDKHLLSSSIDKTARLWRVGSDSCLEVFSHSNYVTCIQFNPVDHNYFISGSLDGKVRMWDISRCRVLDWIDIREIVSAVCYRHNGKGVVVGTITGDCRFYDASDNHLELESHFLVQGKKKSANKRITGFQFCPTDHRKLMVTSADSQVRIVDGVDVVSKYKGLRNSGSQIAAAFTSDGRHIISASEDSNVYIWSHINKDQATCKHVKSTRSCERFSSINASVAIPWNGSKRADGDLHGLLVSSSFTLNQELFSEFQPKGSATWPEEKLPMTASSSLCKSHCKFIKASLESSSSSAWGQVIVTAGWDGRIRSFRNYGLPVS